MLGDIGIPGLILILVIALIIFGPSKLPEIGKAFGRTLKEFKHATKDLVDDDEKDSKITKVESGTTVQSTGETKPIEHNQA